MNDDDDHFADHERDALERRRTKHIAVGVAGLIGAAIMVAYGLWWPAIILIAATVVLGAWSAMS
ncbi:MAG: hypothetical protein ABIQ30_07990 [Devosia sp.]